MIKETRIGLDMSIRPVNVNVRNKNDKKNLNDEMYKGIAIISFKSYGKDTVDVDPRKKVKVNKFYLKLRALKHTLIRVLQQIFLYKSTVNTQVEIFQRSMMYFVICGQCLGLFPMLNIFNRNVPKKRYQIFSWRYLLSIILCLGQMVATVLSLRRLLFNLVTPTTMAYFAFYLSNSITSILFIKLATKWRHLLQLLARSDLNEYIDPFVQFRCNFATVTIISLAFLEHMLSWVAKLSAAHDCHTEYENVYEIFIRTLQPWIFDVNVPYSLPLGIYLQIQNFSSTINWTYSHLFVICVSLYLTSILEQINRKILSREGQYLPVSYWRSLREDYTRATRLVRAFDEVINCIVFVSFASNLFFVCLQLYHVLSHGIRIRQGVDVTCPNYPSGIFNGYEYAIYYWFSLAFVLLRSLTVSLVAARVHSASAVVAPSLYNVPSPAYCAEVQRFIEQVHGDTVALTGLNFFYVTKELVLSVVGTIATYELVLLQFNGEVNTD